MKKIVFLVVLLSFFAVFGGEKMENGTTKTIFSRKSVRNYVEATVPPETLEFLVRAGMAAPSAMDRRPWEFIIINDKTVVKKLNDALPHAKMAEKAGHAIVVAGNIEKQAGGKDSTFWIMDCSAAVENILLAAESLGLGAVWTAVYPNADRLKPVIETLGLPSNIVPLAFIPVGKPDGNDKPKEKFDKEKIHWNHWSNKKAK
ncbi:nitroreductase family protein [bacterium]|nr:nitroreductase family protein [bacterium]